jgi:hypothetical protein
MVEALRPSVLDSAMSSNVLEHVEDDRAALANVAELLPPGSPIFVLVPAFMAIYGTHDRADHHFRRYTKRSFREMVGPLPITVERQYYMNFPGFFAWYILGRIVKKPLGEGELGQSLVTLMRTTA